MISCTRHSHDDDAVGDQHRFVEVMVTNRIVLPVRAWMSNSSP
jgi:hypothetical protein